MASKMKFGIENAVDAEGGGGTLYEGPVPPKGAYRGHLKRLSVVHTGENSQNPGTPMLKILVELKAKKGDKKNAKYDGYGVWSHQMITDQGKGFVNQFLDALTDGSDSARKKIRKGFWEVGVVTEDDDGGHVQKIGTIKIDSPNCNIPVAFNGKAGAYNGEAKLEVAGWLISANSTDDEDDQDDDDADEYDEDEDADEDEDDEGEDGEEDSEDDDDDDDEDDEPEPEPVKKKKAKAKAKKGKELF